MLQHKEATFQTKAIFNVEPFSLLYQRGSLLATTWLCKTNTGTVIFRGCLFSLLYRITHVPSLYSWDVVQLWFANKNVNISSLLPCGASSGFFFIILNSNQTFVCTADTETGLNVILGSRFVFFHRSVHCSILRTYPLTNPWYSFSKKTTKGAQTYKIYNTDCRCWPPCHCIFEVMLQILV